MREALFRGFAQPTFQGPERIFVSRNELNKARRLTNESDLLSTIERLGFMVIRPELLSLQEQVWTFRNAKVVLGAFGAGLANMLFLPPASTVLELQDPDFAPRYWYWKAASILGHEWRCLVGQSTGAQPGSDGWWWDVPFSVEKKRFIEFVEGALEINGLKSSKQWYGAIQTRA